MAGHMISMLHFFRSGRGENAIERGYLYSNAVARLYGDGAAVIAVVVVAFADLYLNIPSHLQRLRLFWTYIFSVHSRVKGDMLLFHRHLQHGSIKTQNPQQNVPGMRQSAHHAPGQRARHGGGGGERSGGRACELS